MKIGKRKVGRPFEWKHRRWAETLRDMGLGQTKIRKAKECLDREIDPLTFRVLLNEIVRSYRKGATV